MQAVPKYSPQVFPKYSQVFLQVFLQVFPKYSSIPPDQFGEEIIAEAYDTRQMSFAPSSEINKEPSGSTAMPTGRP